MTLLGVDIGTTHCKAALFEEDGQLLQLASQPTRASQDPHGYFSYDPENLWETVAATIREATSTGCAAGGNNLIRAAGIASMAESGLLVDRRSGSPRSPFIPWFDRRAVREVELLEQHMGALGQQEWFYRTGLRASFKTSLAKILWLQEQGAWPSGDPVWLSVADYIAYRLTGALHTDYSLAGRTYAFRIDQKAWDQERLAGFGLQADNFPAPLPSGTPVGRLKAGWLSTLGLPEGTPVAISGHDHVCASFALRALLGGQEDLVLDSMGTAEALTGLLPPRLAGQAPLGEPEYRSGLSFGCDVLPDRYYWLGGLSASGGSLEWLRSILGDPALSYADLDALLDETPARPGSILYFPYLSGSGTPHTDSSARGAFVGLRLANNRADLLKAVLEGAAYEVELIRRAAEQSSAGQIQRIAAAGGSTRNRRWLQIKADVSNCRVEVPDIAEATLLGAALVAGIGSGVYAGFQQTANALVPSKVEFFEPDPDRHEIYQKIFEQGYLPLLDPLRKIDRNITGLDSINV